MNMDQYKKSMSEIKVNKFTPEELIKKKNLKVKKFRFVKLIPVLCGIIFAVSLLDFNRKSPDISINVYAAEKETTLTNDFINFDLNAIPLIGSSNLDEQGKMYNSFVNYNINFICEGENIESITYTCTDQAVTRGNKWKADAYYVENLTIPAEEYENHNWKSYDGFISGYRFGDEANAVVTKLIGNSYTVTYQNQTEKQYGLVMAATTDEEGNYLVKALTVKIDITMTDGSLVHKEILIKPSDDDAFSKFQIRVL